MAHLNFKTPSTPINDRFIVNRNSANFELSHYYYSHKSSAVLENANLANERNYSGASEGTQPFRRQVSVPKRGESIRRRLLFETCANTVERDELDHHRVLNFSGKPNENSASSRLDLTRVAAPKTQQRKIALENEVALDAPRVMDDFYLNLMDWSAKGKIAVGLQDEIYLWNQQSKEVHKLGPKRDPNSTLASPDSHLQAGRFVTAIKYNQDGSELAVADSTKVSLIWNQSDFSLAGVTPTTEGSAYACSLAWNHHVLSCGQKDGAITLWDTRLSLGQGKNCGLICQLEGARRDICGLTWSHNDRYLASGSDEGVVSIWDIRTLSQSPKVKPLLSIRAHNAAVKALDWSSWQTNLLATGGGKSDRTIKIWNTDSRKEVARVDTSSQVTGLIWSEENKELISSHGAPGFQLSLWKYPSLTKVADLRGHTGRILSIAKSPNNQYVASLGADETLRVWNCLKPKSTACLSQTPISTRYLSQNFHIR